MKRIEYFDCAKEVDMQKAEKILQTKNVEKIDKIPFYYIMLIWDE